VLNLFSEIRKEVLSNPCVELLSQDFGLTGKGREEIFVCMFFVYVKQFIRESQIDGRGTYREK
jgi:hypothetical protein